MYFINSVSMAWMMLFNSLHLKAVFFLVLSFLSNERQQSLLEVWPGRRRWIVRVKNAENQFCHLIKNLALTYMNKTCSMFISHLYPCQMKVLIKEQNVTFHVIEVRHFELSHDSKHCHLCNLSVTRLPTIYS